MSKLLHIFIFLCFSRANFFKKHISEFIRSFSLLWSPAPLHIFLAPLPSITSIYGANKHLYVFWAINGHYKALFSNGEGFFARVLKRAFDRLFLDFWHEITHSEENKFSRSFIVIRTSVFVEQHRLKRVCKSSKLCHEPHLGSTN